MKEIHQLREQLTYLVNTVYPQDEPIGMDPNLQPPSPEQELLLRQVITAGLVDQVARLHTDRSEMGYINEAKVHHFVYYQLFFFSFFFFFFFFFLTASRCGRPRSISST
jgi:hypothetical protein